GRDQRLQAATVAGSLALFGAPLLGGSVVGDAPQQNRRLTFLDRWLPGSLGGLAGFAAFHGIGAASGGSLQRLPYIWPSSLGEDLGTLGAGLLGGAIGCGLGWLLLRWRGWLEQRQLLAQWPWWPLLTGLLLGACMHWLPLVPFAGEDQMRPLLEGHNASDAWLLLLSAIVKLLMLGLCLETGWRGGVFFPLFLVACALGMGMHLLLPDLGNLGSWCGALTGALYRCVLPTPVAVLVLGLALLQGHGAAGLLVGLGMAHLISSQGAPDGGPPLRP
ncbi:MAG: chloride channel protein, partial [Synechococcus sp.]|nr:chloride channel protein [Synechococcus sp.]